MSKLKIFQGLSEVAGQGYNSVRGLKENGYDAQLVVWRNSPSGYENDYSFQISKKQLWKAPLWFSQIIRMEFRILKSFDVMHFHFGRSLFLNKDLQLLKNNGKKIYYEFHGSDLRDYKKAQKLNPYLQYDHSINSKDYEKRTAKIAQFATGIILHDDELIPYLPDNYKYIFVVPLRVDINRYQYQNNVDIIQNEYIKIVHAPTNRIGKGSMEIIDIVEQLKKDYLIDLVLVENMTQKEAQEIYKSADIIIDQICIGTYGVFAIEGMALGKPVCTYITDSMVECLPKDLPLVNANKSNLKERLIPLIESSELRNKIGIMGRKYVETYHDYHVIGNYLGEIYKGNVSPVRGREAFDIVKRVKNKMELI